MLQALFAEMPHVPPADVTILVATGTHRANTREELEGMLGPRHRRTLRRRESRQPRQRGTGLCGHEQLGRAYLAQPALARRRRCASPRGSSSRTSLPASAAVPRWWRPAWRAWRRRCVLHDARHVGHPRATWGVTEGNPDPRRRAGDRAAHRRAFRGRRRAQPRSGDHPGIRRRALRRSTRPRARYVKATAMCPVDTPFDVVLTTNSGYPLDQNLYQSVKGMSAAAAIVKPGGTIICAAECRDGIPDHGPYGSILRERAVAGGAARDDRGARLLGARRLAGAGAGAHPGARPRCW